MARLTAKYQLTLPKAVAQAVGITPGDDIECEPAGEIIRVRARQRAPTRLRSTTDRLVLFDLATERQEHRNREIGASRAGDRGWTRDELYEP